MFACFYDPSPRRRKLSHAAGSLSSVRWITMAMGLCLAAIGDQATAQPSPAAPRFDSTLWSVDFVGTELGWAVGDAGAIWHTANGGRSWTLQPCPVNCSLRAVDFLDAAHGWAVGEQFDLYTHTSRGVVLTTSDGGKSWQQEAQVLLPALRGIKLLPPQGGATNAGKLFGFAWGQPSGMYPSGLFATEDAGRSWSPVPGFASLPWAAADFVDPLSGAVAGPRGAMGAMRRRTVQASQTPPIGPRDLNAMRLQTTGPAWLVGDGGLVLTSADFGNSWQLPPAPLPLAAYENFDFHAVDVQGAQAWIVGSPGSRILHTPDAGRSWTWLDTGQTLPLHSIKFMDANNGVAVGALGTILVTRDGGKSWTRVQAGGTRLGLLAIFGDDASISWELLAQSAAGEGYLAHVQVVGRPESVDARPHYPSQEERLHHASLAVGASSASLAWQFPLRATEIITDGAQIVAEWDRVHDNRALQRLEEYLVRQIRLWRPEVIVSHGATPSGGAPLAHVMSQVLMRAVERAADPAQFPEHLAGCGLSVWQAKKLLGSLPAGQSGDFSVTGSQVIPRLAQSLAEMAEQARGLTHTSLVEPPVSWNFRLSQSNLPQGVAGHDAMSGISLSPGGEARRPLNEGSGGLEAMRLVQQSQNVRNIMRRAEQNAQQRAAILSQWSQLTRELPARSQGQILYALGEQHRAHGRWDEAAEVLEALARNYPEHAATPAALSWLAQYWSSGEALHRNRRDERVTEVRTVSGVLMVEEGEARNVVRTGGAELPTSQANPSAEQQQLKKASEIEQLLEKRYPHLYAEPALRFPLSVSSVQRGVSNQADRYFLMVRNTRPHDAWWLSAAAERWLVERLTADQTANQPPKPLAACITVPEKPYLDGKLDDPIWLTAKPLELTSNRRDDGEWGAVAYMAHDDEFLYLAATCRKAAGHKYVTSDQPRPRDGDLAAHDRVEFLIDIDRDCGVSYRLAVDHRGWPQEDCWGDLGWDPSWYMAVEHNEASWSLEAAIPLKDLTPVTPTNDVVWGLGVKRIVPGVGFQSWAPSPQPSPDPQNFGLLLWR